MSVGGACSSCGFREEGLRGVGVSKDKANRDKITRELGFDALPARFYVEAPARALLRRSPRPRASTSKPPPPRFYVEAPRRFACALGYAQRGVPARRQEAESAGWVRTRRSRHDEREPKREANERGW